LMQERSKAPKDTLSSQNWEELRYPATQSSFGQ
jgi:hypothetical protein